VILVELCQGEPPFLRENPVKALFLISTQEYPMPQSESYSKKVNFHVILAKKIEFYFKMFSFLDLCLKKNPNKRGSTLDLLENEFLKGIDDNKCRLEIQSIISQMKNCKEKDDKINNSEEQKEEVFV